MGKRLSVFLSQPQAIHWGIFGLCLAMLLAAFVIHPHSEGKLAFFDIALPPMCATRMGLGILCPGCGLTRSWVMLAHGDLSASLAFHRLGWLTMLYVFLQALRHGAWLALPKLRESIDRKGKLLDRAIILVGIALLLNWPLVTGLFSRVFGLTG